MFRITLLMPLVALFACCQSAPAVEDAVKPTQAEAPLGEDSPGGKASKVDEEATQALGLNVETHNVAGVKVGDAELYLAVGTYAFNKDNTAPSDVKLIHLQGGKQTVVAEGFETLFGSSKSVYDDLGYCEEAFADARWHEVSGRHFLSLEVSCRAGEDVISTNTVASLYDRVASLPRQPRRVWTGLMASVESTYGECVVETKGALSLKGDEMMRVVTATASWDAEGLEDTTSSKEDCVVVETDRVTTERFKLDLH